MPYLYTPPQWKNVSVLEGGLHVGIPTSYCVYRSSGTWYSVQSVGMGNPDIATQVDIDAATGFRLFFTKPMVVPSTLQPELAAFGQGTLILL